LTGTPSGFEAHVLRAGELKKALFRSPAAKWSLVGVLVV